MCFKHLIVIFFTNTHGTFLNTNKLSYINLLPICQSIIYSSMLRAHIIPSYINESCPRGIWKPLILYINKVSNHIIKVCCKGSILIFGNWIERYQQQIMYKPSSWYAVLIGVLLQSLATDKCLVSTKCALWHCTHTQRLHRLLQKVKFTRSPKGTTARWWWANCGG